MMMTLGNGTAAGRRYLVRTLAFMLPYVATCVAAMGGVFDELMGKPAAWLLALAVSAPVAGQIWATLSLMRESDEFVRALIARVFIMAAGLTFAVASVWGFGESFAGAPHLPAWLVYPLFWGCFGLVSPFVRSTNA